MKRSHTALLAAGLLLIGTTSAQEPLDNYYPYEQPDYEEESRPMLRSAPTRRCSTVVWRLPRTSMV